MIIKEKDSIESQIKQLKSLLTLSLDSKQKRAVEKELKIIRSGVKGEKDSAYYIDFYFGQSENWVVLHDLRFENKGTVAQIDHLLIGRFLQMYVLESKNSFNGIKITEDGEFFTFHKRQLKAIESPIEQNNRHVFFLEKYFKEIEDIFPKRLGIKIKPLLYSYVLVSPDSKVTRPSKKVLDTSCVIKSDAFHTTTKENIDTRSMLSVGKVIGLDTLEDFARKLAKFHKPAAPINYKNKFGIALDTEKAPAQSERVVEERINPDKKSSTGWKSKYFCASCKVKILKKIAIFCFSNKSRFGGKAYCLDCQKQHVD